MKSPGQDQTYIRREQLDEELEVLKQYLPQKPRDGWVKEIRKALQMTTAQLARRMGKSQSVVSNLEKSEREGTIKLGSLNQLAEALECELHYVLVPKTGLSTTLNERAEKLYVRDKQAIDRQMELEGQGSKNTSKKDIEIAFLIASKDKRIWDE